jgi:hypothetical protein
MLVSIDAQSQSYNSDVGDDRYWHRRERRLLGSPPYLELAYGVVTVEFEAVAAWSGGTKVPVPDLAWPGARITSFIQAEGCSCDGCTPSSPVQFRGRFAEKRDLFSIEIGRHAAHKESRSPLSQSGNPNESHPHVSTNIQI